jgi:hypothetical protein
MEEEEQKKKGSEYINAPFQCLPSPDHYLKVTECNCLHIIHPVHDDRVREDSMMN